MPTYCNVCSERLSSFPKDYNNYTACVICYEKYYRCDVCNDLDMDIRYPPVQLDGIRYCSVCVEEKLTGCVECGNYVLKEDAIIHRHSTYCQRCYERVLERSIIMEYNYVPRFYKRKLPTENNPVYMGFELEIEPKRGIKKLKLAQEIQQFLERKKLNKLFYFKHDGSLENGFEIVSQPSSLRFIKKNNIRSLLEFVSERAVSETSERCGFHVHVTKEKMIKNFNKALLFFNNNYYNILKFSLRSECNLQRWANVIAFDLHNYINANNNYIYYPESKYTALRTHREAKTIEFRIFRGTLAYKKVMANLEFTDSVINFVSNYSFVTLGGSKSWQLFLEFSKKYKFLNDVLSKMSFDSPMDLVSVKNKKKKKKRKKKYVQEVRLDDISLDQLDTYLNYEDMPQMVTMNELNERLREDLGMYYQGGHTYSPYIITTQQ